MKLSLNIGDRVPDLADLRRMRSNMPVDLIPGAKYVFDDSLRARISPQIDGFPVEFAPIGGFVHYIGAPADPKTTPKPGPRWLPEVCKP